MEYISTRGHSPSVRLKDLLTSGTAEDGGLYVPEFWPTLSTQKLDEFASKPYGELASKLLDIFGGEDWVAADFSSSIRHALNTFTIDHPPLECLDGQLWALDLFHGPTCAFKDYALAPLAETIGRKLHLDNSQATVLCATSGDTGAATAAAFAGRARTRAIVLFPKGRISSVQRRQMTTLGAENVLALAVKGDFDDCQRLVKQLYRTEKAIEYGYTAVNSINLARILLQTAYYIYSAFKVYKTTGHSVNFIVPTGNFGNIFAGYIAKHLGAPIATLVITSNENDILPRLFESGQMYKNITQPTISPSMDIQISSNFERMLWLIKNQNSQATRQLQDELDTTNSYNLSNAEMAMLRQHFKAVRCNKEQALETMRWAWKKFSRVVCPHSATAYFAANTLSDHLAGPILVTETAHPAKFPEAVVAALGNEPPLPDTLANILSGKEHFIEVESTVESVQASIDSAL